MKGKKKAEEPTFDELTRGIDEKKVSPQKALQIIGAYRCELADCRDMCEDEFKIIQRLVDKSKPLKTVVIYNKKYGIHERCCPRCKKHLPSCNDDPEFDDIPGYCPNCGQHLRKDWRR